MTDSERCDGTDDCGDKTDEEGCSSSQSKDKLLFKCAAYQAIFSQRGHKCASYYASSHINRV